jgi:predicted small secreted protein
MKMLLLKPLIILALLSMTVGLVGCNTVEGFGEDMKTLGEKIEKKAGQSSDSSDY